MNRDHIPAEEAKAIENNYRKGFKGVATYQSQQRKLVMKLGYINTCPEVGFRAYIYDFDELSKIQARFSEPNFWDDYRSLKVTNPSSPIVEDVKHYFKRKSASERQSINYPIQSRGSAIFKIAAVNLFNWVVKNNLFNVVKFCIPAHDEFNIEAPKEIAEEVAAKLHECMVKAGAFICRIVPLDAEISRHKICIKDYEFDGVQIMKCGDPIADHDKEFVNLTTGIRYKYKDLPDVKACIGSNGPLPTYWIH